MRFLPIVMLSVIAACSMSPSKYVSFKDKQGYSDKIMDPNLRVASFQGNSATKKETAELYAKFRAIELCHEGDKKYTHILRVKDKTFTKEISQTSTVTPSYYYGMSPYYSRAGLGMGVAYMPVSTTTSNDTYTYPSFDVYFECVDKALDARISLQDLSSSQVTKLVKDVMGAPQVDDVLSDSPNVGVLKKGDIIVAANGERVGNTVDLFKASRASMNKPFSVEFFREGVRKSTRIRFSDVTELVAESQAEIIKKACKEDGIKGVSPLCK